MKLDPKAKVLFTNSSLYYTMKIGTHYRCMFQSANHAPGAGYITRPDLFAGLVKNHIAKHITSRLDLTFVPQTFRLFQKDECQAFFKMINAWDTSGGASPSSSVLLGNEEVMFVKKHLNSKRSLKLTNLDRLRLDKLYKNGTLCGQRVRGAKTVIQEFVHNQILFEDKFMFKLKAFLFVASYDPLVAYYHEDGVELKQPDEMSSTRIKEFKDLMIFLLAKGFINSEQEFNRKIKEQIKSIMRATLALSQDKLNRDPQFFDIFSFQMVLDSNLKLKLISANQNPDLKLRNKETVEKMLGFLFDLGQHRHAKVRTLMESVAAAHQRTRPIGNSTGSGLEEEQRRRPLASLSANVLEKFEEYRRSWPDAISLPTSFEAVWDSRSLPPAQ